MIEAVIFDVDGTLVDSNDFHARAWQEAFRHFGKDIFSGRGKKRDAAKAVDAGKKKRFTGHFEPSNRSTL